MKFRPPKHRVDSPIVFIHPADDAWDQDAVAKSEEDNGEDCPFLAYHRGDTRYDSSGVQHLFSGQPVEFHLRRLSVIELNEVQSLMERDIAQQSWRFRAAYLQSARYGLTAVKQGGSEILKLRSPGSLSNDDVEAIGTCTELGIDLLKDIGRAVHLASQPLRDDEKKR